MRKLVFPLLALVMGIAFVMPEIVSQFQDAENPSLEWTDEFVAENDATTAEPFVLTHDRIENTETVTVNDVELVFNDDYVFDDNQNTVFLFDDSADVGDEVVATYQYPANSIVNLRNFRGASEDASTPESFELSRTPDFNLVVQVNSVETENYTVDGRIVTLEASESDVGDSLRFDFQHQSSEMENFAVDVYRFAPIAILLFVMIVMYGIVKKARKS